MANEAAWEALPKREQQEKENTLRTESELPVYLSGALLTDCPSSIMYKQHTWQRHPSSLIP